MAVYRMGEDPVSRLALWSRRLAIFALPTAIVAVLVLRTGLLEIVPALVTFAGALVIAVTAIVLALCSFVVIWREGARGLGAAIVAILIGLSLIVYPTYFAYKAYRLPEIADITTDAIDPPRFEAIARLRNRDTNPAEYAGLFAAEQQRIAYPDVEPLEVEADARVVFDAVHAAITKRRWLIVDARPPQPGRRDGRIEAVARTPIMGFRDDVVVRIRSTGRTSARLDMRSASRYGRHDFGSNAKRVQSLIEDVDQLIDSDKAEKRERAQRRNRAQPRNSQPARR